DAADVHVDAGMGVEPFGRHGQLERDDIARSPEAMDGDIAIDGRCRDRLAVDLELVRAGPAGDAQLDVEAGGRGRIDGDADVARPGLVGGFAEAGAGAGDVARGGDAAIDVEGDSICGGRDELAADRGDEAADIHGAAGAG